MIDIEILRTLLRYEPDSGKLFWLPRNAAMFDDGYHPASHHASVWNTRYAGSEAFPINHRDGYRRSTINRRSYLAHRVVWALHYGAWPNGHIDHINGDRSDNRIVNLRDVPRQENNKNAARRHDNKSGVTGVYWCKRDKAWIAYIRVNKRAKCLGYFKDFEQAVAARKAADLNYKFHPNHGRAA